jgi:hypothetical protein
LGQLQQAQIYLTEILQLGISTGGLYPILYALVGAALLLMDRGEVERGLEIYALAERYPFVKKSRWFEDIAGRELSAAAASLPPEAVAGAQEGGEGATYGRPRPNCWKSFLGAGSAFWSTIL